LQIDRVQQLRNQATRSIEASHPKLSNTRKLVLAGMLAHIATDVFRQQVNAQYWIALIGVESRYEGTARSKTGAVGLGQLIPSYRQDFGKGCQLGDVALDDLRDDYTNAYLSACYFRSLLQTNNGNIPLALVSYNQGLSSKDVASTKRGGAPGTEASAYVTKVWVKKNKAEKHK